MLDWLGYRKRVSSMFLSWLFGPVFHFEWRSVSRRWQMYAIRSLFISVLLAALAFVWWRELADRHYWGSLEVYARVGRLFCTMLLETLFALVVIVSPTISANAICQDKARGPLFHLFTTDIRDREIILGKLMVRWVPLFGLLGCSLPVLFLSTLFGGIELKPLIGSFLVLTTIAMVGCTFSLVISVWAKRTYEVLLLTFTFWGLILLANPIIKTIAWFTNLEFLDVAPKRGWPMPVPVKEADYSLLSLVLAPIESPASDSLQMAAVVFGFGATLTILLLMLAIRNVRRVTLAQAGQSQRRTVPTLRILLGFGKSNWLPRPPLDWNPVLWREWQRRRASLLSTITWTIYVLLAILLSARAFVANLYAPRSGWMTPDRAEFPALVNGALVAVGLLLLSVTSVTSLVEERDRGSLDVLLTTPLPTWQILTAKWIASYRSVLPLAFFPALLALVLAQSGHGWEDMLRMIGLVLAYGTVITSLGLGLATWIKKPSRALTLSVTFYVLVSISWLPVALLTKQDLGFFGEFLALASPFYMVHNLTLATMGHGSVFVFDAWASLWMAAYPYLAAGLFYLTLRSFNSCMGRLHGGDARPKPDLNQAAIAQALPGGWG